MLPYGRQSMNDEDIAAVVEVLRGDWLTTGPTVDAFEEAISSLAGGHRAVSCTSGTAALHIAYSAIGLRPGDEVITTPMTFVATASTASMLGATVTFADIDLETGLIDPNAAESVISGRTRVIAAVDYAGQPADYKKLQSVADKAGAYTLADAAHSIGGSASGRPVGDLADITTMSFFPTKNMTTGEGGAAVFKDAELGRRAHEFHIIGLVRDAGRLRSPDEGPWHQEVHEFGLNYRLSDLACAIGLSQLRRLDDFKRRRAEITEKYNLALKDVSGISTPVSRPDVDPAWHLYPLRILEGRRRLVFERMRAAGIGVQVNYIPVYRHPVYADMGYKRGCCPNAEQFYSEELSLPLYPDLTDSQVDWVIDSLLRALR